MAQINLPANLPEDWVKSQIIPANGSDQGVQEQYGYNYLMKQVNAAQRALNNLDSSQMLYGKSDLQTIGDALDNVIAGVSSLNENKANGKWTFYNGLEALGINPGTETPEAIVNAMSNYSELWAINVTNFIPSGVQSSFNLLRVVKTNSNRVSFELFDMAAQPSARNRRFEADFRNTLGDWTKPWGDSGSNLPRIHNAYDIGSAILGIRNIYVVTAPIVASDKRIKKDISMLDIVVITKLLMTIPAVRYRLINGESGRFHYGFLTQDVEKALTEAELTSMDFAGFIKSPVLDDDGNETGDYIYALRLEEFIPILWGVSQDLVIKNQSNEQNISLLQHEIETLKAELQEIHQTLNQITFG